MKCTNVLWSDLAPRPFIHNHVVELTGPDQATGTCYVEIRATRDGKSWIGAGYYDDEYAKVGGAWKFHSRKVTMYYMVPLSEGWAKRRHSDKTGRWLVECYFPPQAGEAWRFTDPVSGKQLLRVREAIKPQRYLKVKGVANPFDPAWEVYFQDRDRKLALRASSPFRAKILRQQHGSCPGCRQMIQVEEDVELHHRDGDHQHNHLGNLVLLHPTCHRQEHYAPEHTPASSRPSWGVGYA